MPLWEYKVCSCELAKQDPEAMLNEFGREGWELVSADFHREMRSATSLPPSVLFVLKRRPEGAER